MVAMNNYKSIGVVGGMGPNTSIQFYDMIVKLFQEEKDAEQNYQFPEMMIHNVPCPDPIEGIVGEELLPYVTGSCQRLERAGMDFIAIPCNTAHLFIEEARAEVNIPILSIVEETMKVVVEKGMKNVLLLGAITTIKTGLYEAHAAEAGVSLILPTEEEMKESMAIIVEVCAGRVDEALHSRLNNQMLRYPEAEAVILGCTELPLAVDSVSAPKPFFDTLEILARAAYEQSAHG